MQNKPRFIFAFAFRQKRIKKLLAPDWFGERPIKKEFRTAEFQENRFSSFPVNWMIRGKICPANRLNGGNRDNGGLANVNYNTRGNRNDNIAGRCLAVSEKTPLSASF